MTKGPGGCGRRLGSARGANRWLALIVGTAIGGSEAAAQELRFSGSGFYGGQPEIGWATGYGGGARFFLGGLGIGVDLDRLSSSPAVRRITCPEGITTGPDCGPEIVDMSTEGELTTLLVLFGGVGETWNLRVGVGRVAATFRSRGEGRTTGRNIDVPPADLGAGTIAWSRGADGVAMVLELLRRLPVPGPLPVSLQATYRRLGLRMEGCVVGVYSPFCGPKAINELQVGVHLGLRPAPRPPSRP